MIGQILLRGVSSLAKARLDSVQWFSVCAWQSFVM